MLARVPSRSSLAVALGASALFAAGCVHPLGPGYEFADRQAEIRVSADSPGQIRFHVADDLQNDGDRPLRSLDVRLPAAPQGEPQNVRVLIEGAQVSPGRGSPVDARIVRAPFQPIWQQNETRKIVTEWDLVPEISPRGTIVASPEGFFIADESAFPLWQTPKGVFSRGGTKPDKELLTIVSPPDFRVLAPGKPLKQSADGNQIARRYLVAPGNDFFAYVVAGRYLEDVVHSRQGDVQFWTFRALDPGAAQIAADRLSASMNSFREFFGPASSGKVATRIAESPVELPPEFSAVQNHGGASFPMGVLLDPHAISSLATNPVLELAEYELARTWFGWRVRPRPEAQILMGRGVGLFGLVIAAEGRGPQERRGAIESMIARYDEARAAALDKPLVGVPDGYSRAERISTGYRGALFLAALEDLCGRDSLKNSFRQIIYARASSDTGYEELRAALESESGKDLAQMFRRWLSQPGIPDDFRERYRPGGTGLQPAALTAPRRTSGRQAASLSY